jgi:hypothetical protein
MDTTIRTLDGLRLSGTLVTPEESAERAVVLVHGGGVTREEGGFFTQLATGLGGVSVRITSLSTRSVHMEFVVTAMPTEARPSRAASSGSPLRASAAARRDRK